MLKNISTDVQIGECLLKGASKGYYALDVEEKDKMNIGASLDTILDM